MIGPEWEHKYAVRSLPLARFLRAVDGWVVPEVHDPARPIQYTRTTYLDTPDRAYLRSGATGLRVRLRIREYAAARTLAEAPVLTGLCFLELKESEGTRRTKVRWPAPAALVRTLVATGGLLLGETGAPPELALRLREDRPVPVATTWYRRRAFVNADGVRITVDDAVSFSAPVPSGAPGLPAAPEDPVEALAGHILEVKHTGAPPPWLAAALTGLPAQTSASKFDLAMRALGR
jgi:hypothetical protein